jgi:AraC-like DNA-binding protein
VSTERKAHHEHFHLRSPILAGVELRRTTWEERQPEPAWLSQLSLMLCDEGAAGVRCGRRLQPLRPRDVLLHAPRQVSATVQEMLPGTSCRLVLVEPELLSASGAERSGRLLRFASFVTNAEPLVEAVRRLWSAIVDDLPPEQQRSRLGALIEASLAVADRAAPPPSVTSGVARTRDALHERFAEELRLDELAVVAGMSKCHLVHTFHKEIGLPPHAYQIHLRVAHARALIASGLPLAEIASMTGFADQSHLTRLFKRIVGLPPGQYAAALAANSEAAAHQVLAV